MIICTKNALVKWKKPDARALTQLLGPSVHQTIRTFLLNNQFKWFMKKLYLLNEPLGGGGGGGWNEPALHLLNEPPWGWFYLSVSQHIWRWKNSTFNKKQIHCGMLVRCVPACEGHVKNGRHHSSQSAECTKSFYPWTFNQCFRGLLR